VKGTKNGNNLGVRASGPYIFGQYIQDIGPLDRRRRNLSPAFDSVFPERVEGLKTSSE
jgi:hypothetical protein